ncbi:MAG: oligoendopeptidase F [Chloroflexota bacterium]
MAVQEAPTALPPRKSIEESLKWNREAVYADRTAWKQAAAMLPRRIPELAAYKGRLSEGPAVLAEFREKAEAVQREMMNIYFYAMMEGSVNAKDTETVAMIGQAGSLYGQVMATLSFLNPELLGIGQATLEKWIAEEPRLSDMAMYVDNLFRQQAHVREDAVEMVLGLAQEPFGSVSSIYDQLTSSDMNFRPAVGSDGKAYPVAQATIDTLYNNPDRAVRRTAYESYTDTYLSLKNTLAATYLTSVKQDVFKMRVRGYDSSLHASLYANRIPVEVYHNLLETFKANIPTWHRYWAVRRKVLGVDAIYPYDIWAPLTNAEINVPYAQSVEWISQGLKPLGEAYVTALQRGCLEERWVDRAVNEGKRQGAFSFGTYDTAPYIMMSYDDSLGAMSTLAHELGHSMHSYLSRKNQSYINASYSLFAAEVASNFNQAMTRAYLRDARADDTLFQIALIEEAMDNFHRYFLIMPTLARFELEVHARVEQGQGLTADDLNNLCADLFGEAYGDEMSYDRDRVGITWATFGHLYNAYYTYSYATGISAAHELAKHILAGESGAAERYVGFLSAGGSLYPIDALNNAGVNMTQPDAVKTTFGVLADMVNRLADLAGVTV